MLLVLIAVSLPLQQVEELVDASRSVAEVAAAAESGVVLLHTRNAAVGSKQCLHFLGGDKTLRVIRDKNMRGRDGTDEVAERICRFGSGIVGRAVPIFGYTGYGRHAQRTFVFCQ